MATLEEQQALAAARLRRARALAASQQVDVAQFAELSALSRPQAPQQAQNFPVQRGEVENRLQSQPGIGERILDNVVGLDNGVMSAGEQIAAALNKGGESMTLGVVGDEAAGAFDEAIGRRAPGTGTEFYRQQERALQEENPALAIGAEVGGALVAPGLGAARYAAAGATRAAQLGRAALAGGAAGGVYGAAEGEGGLANRAASGAMGAAVGGFFGAAVPAVSSGIANLWRRAEKRPSVGLLREIKNRAYKAVEDAGEVFDGDEMTGLSQRVQGMMDADVGYVPGEDTAVDAAIKTLTRREGQNTTVSQLDRIRQRLWSRVSRNSDQVQIYDLIGEIDNLLESRAGVSELMAQARDANRQFSQTKLLDDAFQRARRQAESTGSAGNVSNLYRQAINRILSNQRQARFFSDDQVRLMNEFLVDSGSQRMRRLVGKMSPSGNGLMLMLQTLGGFTTGGATIPLAVAGSVAKNSADKSVERGAQGLLNNTAGFVPDQMLIGRGQLAAGQIGVTAADEPARLLQPNPPR